MIDPKLCFCNFNNLKNKGTVEKYVSKNTKLLRGNVSTNLIMTEGPSPNSFFF